MRSLIYLRALLLMVFGLLLTESAFATHIRAGEITAKRTHPQKLEYEITLWGYIDTKDSEVLFGSNGTLDFGDGNSLVINFKGDDPRMTITQVNDETALYKFKITHTFPSARSYRVSFREFYRNDGVLNMDNSVNMPFYIETVIVIDPLLGINNTPQLLIPPIDKAAVGKLYVHNPGAYDVDGDSLSYRLVVVRQDVNEPVANYRYPQNTFPEGDPRNGQALLGGEPTLTLNPATGDLIWNTPGTKGEYNVAFYVEEWRKINGKYYLLGHVTRDMQILVEGTDNEPPVITIPNTLCVVAGENIEEKIKISDPNKDKVAFSFFGGPFSLGADVTVQGKNPQSPDTVVISTDAEAVFRWQTECADIRRQPYQAIFKATDQRGNDEVELTDIKTWLIKVVAPPPAIESVTALDSRSIEINFDRSKYFCGEQASAVQVWRREGSVNIELDTCNTGMPAGAGYQLVNTLKLKDEPFPYVDKSAGLKPGSTYCYRLVMVFPEPAGGESLVSEEMCVTLPAKMPLITNVSILETHPSEGIIQVRWVNGPDLSENEVTKPYLYDLYRSEGFEGGTYRLVQANIPFQENAAFQEFTDSAPGLNTRDLPYSYYVMLKDANGVEFDKSSTASTVRATPIPGLTSITLQWEASVPWSNRVKDYPVHYVYRSHVNPNDENELVLIAEVNVVEKGFTYVDDGSDAGTGPLLEEVEYCYYVTTSGSYSNTQLTALDPLLNNSQITCSYIKDEVPPCPPLTLELAEGPSCEQILREKSCDDQSFVNTLNWTSNIDDELCFRDLSHWLVYYSPDGKDYQVVGEGVSSGIGNWTFDHDDLEGTMAGFYYVQAVDRSGNLSEPSEIIMRDNCPNYWLPNVITRNGDKINDELRPPKETDYVKVEGGINQDEFRARCPRFVEGVVFKVYNRWGKQVYEYSSATDAEKSIYINWDGRTSGGEKVTSGTYYYIVDVTYKVLDPEKRTQSIKGWVYVTDVKSEARDTR